MAVTDLNKVSYVDQDFSTAVTQVSNFLNSNYPDEFNDYSNSNLGVALIDIIAFAEQNVLWYLNRKVTDLYFPTARTPRSISKIARMLGYKSIPATAAKTTVSITLDDGPYTFPVQITKGFQWNGPNNQVWEYRGVVPVIFNPGITTVSGVTLVQGETVTNNFVSDGENNQFFDMLSVPNGKFVEGESVQVKVDGELWDEQDIIPFTTENNYETNLLAFPPVLRFGDSVQGNVPPIGSAIELVYSITDGFRGRIVSSSIGDPVVGLIAQFQGIPITVSQPNGSVGGDDPEDIRSITTKAPLFQRTQDRAITKGDYDFLSNQFTDVARADAQILRGVSGDVVIQTLVGSIITTVSAVADGSVQETSGFQYSMVSSVEAINYEADVFGVSALAIIDPFITSISGKTDNICATVNTQLDAMRAAMTPYFDAAVTDLSSVDTESLTLIDSASTIISIKNASINGLLDDIETVVAGDPLEAAVDALTAIIRTKLIELKSEVLSAAISANSVIDSETDSAVVNINSILGEAESVSGSIAIALAPDKTCIASDLGQINLGVEAAVSGFQVSVSGYLDQINSDLDSINNAFLVQTSGMVESVSGDLDSLLLHLDAQISDSCKANEVQVKVLGKDANRKYVAPLQITLDSLEAYLDERKDITHTISVVEGTTDVIDAVVEILVRVNDNALEDDVLATISDSLAKSDAEPLGILVERAFNKPLYVWEINDTIRDAVEDGHIDYLNVRIKGPAQYLDVDGNLISPAGFVIQVGSVTVTALPRFT